MRRSALLFVMMLAAVATNRGASAQFPPDSGVVNARTFGAKGDGKHDDTAALTAAISAAGEDTGALFWRTRIVVLPAGTYRVSAPLMKRYANGKFGSGMILIGESPTNTTIRLADHAPGFGNAAAPRGVIMTTAKLLDGSPTSGGKDYTNKGEGNDAYENFVENLTIDVGAGNPGAIGIDYLANNIGAIRNVRVTAPPGSGAVGISMQRKWPGPALLQRVDVQGFATGIAVANTEYGVTLDHVRLGGQRDIGLANDGNAVTAADLTIDAPATAIANRAPGGLIALTKTVLRRNGEGATALSNHGSVVAHGVMLEGFAPPDGAGGSLKGVWQGEQWKAEQAQVGPDARGRAHRRGGPAFALGECHPLRPTVRPSGRHNGRVACRAWRRGAATVYLPHGRYTIDDGIAIPPTLRRFVGMNASITVRPERQPSFARDTGMFRIDQAGPPLVIERLAFDMTDLGDQLAVQVSAQRDVTLRDIVTAGTSLLDRERGRRARVHRGRLLRQACTLPDPARSMPASSIPRVAKYAHRERRQSAGDPRPEDGRCLHGAGEPQRRAQRDPWRPALHGARRRPAGAGIHQCRWQPARDVRRGIPPLRQPVCRLPARPAARGARGGISGARLRPDRALANSRPLMDGCRDMDRPPGSPAWSELHADAMLSRCVTVAVGAIHVDAR